MGKERKRKTSDPAYKEGDRAGIFKIIEVLGYKKKEFYGANSRKFGWQYSVECISCGDEYKKGQQDLHYAKNMKVKNCKHCASTKAGGTVVHQKLHEVLDVPPDLPDFSRIKLTGF